jgi:hypothetical protein
LTAASNLHREYMENNMENVVTFGSFGWQRLLDRFSRLG